jgi:protease-4
MVGSVGVLMDGFGFVDTMKTLGVERRLLTAGSNKGFMDPFSPQKENETQHMKVLLKQVHAQFIKAVKEGRGDRLKGDEDVLFSGLVWSGEEGLKLGIIDGFGSTASIARDVVKQEKMIDYTATTDLVERLADKLGASVGKYVFEALGLGASIKLK